MADERRTQDEEVERHGEHRRREAEAAYTHARTQGSLEGERAALQSLDMQTLRNQIDRLERRVAALEEEITALKAHR